MTEDRIRDYDIAMVGFDLTEMDDHIIQYLDMFLKKVPLERIIFVHIARELELPEAIVSKYPDLLAPLDENITDGIKDKIEPIFEGLDVQVDIIVQEGPPLDTFLRLAKIKNVDLIILGRKRQLDGDGILANHIVRKSPASILFITENKNPKLEKVLIPVDFSQHSSIALDIALRLRKHADVGIHFSHLYQVPIGFYKTGKTHEEFAAIMKGHAENDLKQFLRDNDIDEDLPCHYILAEDEPKASLINACAHEQEMDMILIGSRGRTTSSAMLIGSIVEKVLMLDTDIPVLVVKNRGENMGFFEALMKL